MSPFACSRERELLRLVHAGQWPQASPADLRAHVAACRSCAELVLVAGAFQGARRHAVQAVPPHLPTPGALFWRAQLRRRRQAMERVARPVLTAQLFAIAVALLAALALLTVTLRRSASVWADLEAGVRNLNPAALLPATLPHGQGALWLLLPVLAMLAVAGCVAACLASEKG